MFSYSILFNFNQRKKFTDWKVSHFLRAVPEKSKNYGDSCYRNSQKQIKTIKIVFQLINEYKSQIY